MMVEPGRRVVSVIMPVRDGQRHIAAAIESLINQTYNDFELIIVDDGSTDFTREIARRYAGADKRIRYIRTDTSHGVSIARNKGLQIATGRYVTFVDSDDIAGSRMLEYLVSVSEKTGARIVISPVAHSMKAFSENIGQDEIILCKPVEIMESMFYQRDGFDSAPFAKLFDRRLFSEINFEPGLRYEDLLILPKLYSQVTEIARINQKIYYYRKNRFGFMNSDSSSHLDLLTVTERLEKEIGSQVPELMAALKHRRFSALMNILRRYCCRRLDIGTSQLNLIESEIKQLAPEILRDKNARLKNRAMALLSYAGMSVVKFMMKW